MRAELSILNLKKGVNSETALDGTTGRHEQYPFLVVKDTRTFVYLPLLLTVTRCNRSIPIIIIICKSNAS